MVDFRFCTPPAPPLPPLPRFLGTFLQALICIPNTLQVGTNSWFTTIWLLLFSYHRLSPPVSWASWSCYNFMACLKAVLGKIAHVRCSGSSVMLLSLTLGGRNVAHWQDRTNMCVHIPVKFSPCQTSIERVGRPFDLLLGLVSQALTLSRQCAQALQALA